MWPSPRTRAVEAHSRVQSQSKYSPAASPAGTSGSMQLGMMKECILSYRTKTLSCSVSISPLQVVLKVALTRTWMLFLAAFSGTDFTFLHKGCQHFRGRVFVREKMLVREAGGCGSAVDHDYAELLIFYPVI